MYATEIRNETQITKTRLTYFKSNVEELVHKTTGETSHYIRVFSDSDNPMDISYTKYKELLLNSIRDILEILRYDVERELLKSRMKLCDSVYSKNGASA